jgi:hypothetical protein
MTTTTTTFQFSSCLLKFWLSSVSANYKVSTNTQKQNSKNKLQQQQQNKLA